MLRIYKSFEVTRLVYSNCETEYIFNFLLEVPKTLHTLQTIKMLIGTNSWAGCSSRKLQEQVRKKNLLNIGSHLVSATGHSLK